MKVLRIDDEPLALECLALQLGSLGCNEVLACTGATEALRLLDCPGVGVAPVPCDLRMPGMDGVPLIRHLSERRYGAALVLMSGEEPRVLHAAGQLARAHQIRLLGTLEKPVPLAALCDDRGDCRALIKEIQF